MPYISDDNRKVNVFYPESDPTWTPEVLKALGNYNTVVGYPWMKMGCITMNGLIGRSRKLELISRKESRNESVQNAAKRKRLKYQDRFVYTNGGG